MALSHRKMNCWLPVFSFSHITGLIIFWSAIIPMAKHIGASHALIDAFIKDHAGKNLLLILKVQISPILLFFTAVLAQYKKYTLH